MSAVMNREISRRLLIAEALLLVLPISALLVLGLTAMSISTGDAWPWRAIDLVTVLAAIATFAGWWLIVKAVRGGAEALRAAHLGWWLVASIGVLLVLAAGVSMLLPASPEYTPTAHFREHLERCMLGVPLVVVLGHLCAEARFRRPAEIATREGGRA